MLRGITARRGIDAPVIGQPRLVSSPLGPSLDDVPGRLGSDPATTTEERASRANDPELVEQRLMEIFRRIRILCDDSSFRHLTGDAWNHRAQFLDWYRATEFTADLAEGRCDGFPAALDNQEHDGYYSDLWERISRSSWTAARALRERIQPHKTLTIALTIPPRYEVSDLPPYTATESPPDYSGNVVEGHVVRDVPLCTARDCPLQTLGIEHTLGLYHHNGQVGPNIQSEATCLPSFGRSNPPPHIWDAYNHLVLRVNTDTQADLVMAFIRYHGRRWAHQAETLPVREKRPESRVNLQNHIDRWSQDQGRRIPRYSYDRPGARRAAAETHGLEEDRDLPFEARLASVLDARRYMGTRSNGPFEAVAERHTIGNSNSASHQYAGYATGHRHDAIRFDTTHIHHAPIRLPGIGEVIDRNLVPAPLFAAGLRRANHDETDQERVYRQRLIRFADELDAESDEVRPS
ncbi:MAG: hypothetical protein Q9172_006169 [Xanthocarpia lactea]